MARPTPQASVTAPQTLKADIVAGPKNNRVVSTVSFNRVGTGNYFAEFCVNDKNQTVLFPDNVQGYNLTSKLHGNAFHPTFGKGASQDTLYALVNLTGGKTQGAENIALVAVAKNCYTQAKPASKPAPKQASTSDKATVSAQDMYKRNEAAKKHLADSTAAANAALAKAHREHVADSTARADSIAKARAAYVADSTKKARETFVHDSIANAALAKAHADSVARVLARELNGGYVVFGAGYATESKNDNYANGNTLERSFAGPAGALRLATASKTALLTVEGDYRVADGTQKGRGKTSQESNFKGGVLDVEATLDKLFYANNKFGIGLTGHYMQEHVTRKEQVDKAIVGNNSTGGDVGATEKTYGAGIAISPNGLVNNLVRITWDNNTTSDAPADRRNISGLREEWTLDNRLKAHRSPGDISGTVFGTQYKGDNGYTKNELGLRLSAELKNRLGLDVEYKGVDENSAAGNTKGNVFTARGSYRF